MLASHSETATVDNVVVIVAMQQEAEPFIKKHNLKENKPSPFQPGSPMVSYSGRIASATRPNVEISVHLVWNGRCKIHNVNHVATTAAAISTYAAISCFHPSIVISAGTAGGFSELGACIGDVFLSTKCVFHGRRIPLSLANGQDKGYLEEYGFGHFRSPPLPKLAKAVNLKQGVVSTSDSLDCTEMDLQLLRSEGAVVKEMEAASVAWVCQQLYTPFFALKSITDIVDGPHRSEDEFYRNLELASNCLQERLSTLLGFLAGTELQHWHYSFQSNLDINQERLESLATGPLVDINSTRIELRAFAASCGVNEQQCTTTSNDPYVSAADSSTCVRGKIANNNDHSRDLGYYAYLLFSDRFVTGFFVGVGFGALALLRLQRRYETS